MEYILKSIGYVRQYAENVTFEQFVNDTMRYFAIMKKSIETASNLKEMGLTNEQIAEATGLTIREIEEL